MRSDVLKKMALVAVAVMWTLFAAEMFLRLFDPQPMLPRYIQAGDFGVRVNMPDQVYTHQTPEYNVEIRTNSKGMRADREFPYEKKTGTKRIVVLGDSFGMGYGVSLEQSFTERLRLKLEAELQQPVEIINLSVSGFGTAEELLMLQHEGVKYQPDLVLLAWHATDLDDNLRSDLFVIDNGKLVRNKSSYLPGVKTREFLFSFAVYRWLAGHSHFYNWVREFAGSRIKQVMAAMRRSDGPHAGEEEDASGSDIQLSMALLAAVKQESAHVGAQFLILDIPIRVSRSEFESSIPEEIRRSFDIVSPVEAFRQHLGSLLYWEKSHGHFTPLGCELVASELMKRAMIMLRPKDDGGEGRKGG